MSIHHYRTRITRGQRRCWRCDRPMPCGHCPVTGDGFLPSRPRPDQPGFRAYYMAPTEAGLAWRWT